MKSAAPLCADMSIKAVKWALSTKTDAINKLALVAIAECHNDKTGDCFPSQKYVAEVIGLTDRAARPRLNKLEADGFFTRKPRYDAKGKRTSDRYVLHFEVTDPDAADWWDDEPRLPEAVTSASERPVLPEAATSGSEPDPENLLPEVFDRLPEDTASGTNLLTGRLRTNTYGSDIYSEGVIYSEPREPRTKTLEAAHGRWRWILTSFGIPESALNGKEHHVPHVVARIALSLMTGMAMAIISAADARPVKA